MMAHNPTHKVVTFTRIQLGLDEPTPHLAPEVPDPRGWKAIFDELISTDCEITNGLWAARCGRIEERPGEALLIMQWESPEDLNKFKLSPLYTQFLRCFRLEGASQRQGVLAAATTDYMELIDFDGLTSITTISFRYPATKEQHQRLDALQGLGYRYGLGPGLTLTKANVNYDKLRLWEPQLGPAGEKFEQTLVLHEWENADQRRRFHRDWPDRQAVWEQQLRELDASSIHEETAVLIPVEDVLSEARMLRFFGRFLNANAEVENRRI